MAKITTNTKKTATTKTDEIALKVEGVSKDFILPHNKKSSLKQTAIGLIKRDNEREVQNALKDISFEVKKGEFFGVVGRNGSGKSTLLKILAGVYTPTKGRVEANGSLVPFLELGVGFNQELSGRDNVFLNGALFGFSRKEMEKMYDDIVEFAELGRFMDQKLKNYSSGMQVRLAFSIATRVKGDILLLDEVLAVGDSAFQQKCNDYFAELKRENQTIVLVSHNMAAIERYCDRAILLENSKIMGAGSSEDVAGMYEDMMLKEEAVKKTESPDYVTYQDSRVISKASVSIVQSGETTKTVKAFQKFQIVLKLKSQKPITDVRVGVNIKNSEKQIVFAAETKEHIEQIDLKKNKEKSIIFEVDNIFTNGAYSVGFTIVRGDDGSSPRLLKVRSAASFTVFGVRKNAESLIHPSFSVKQD